MTTVINSAASAWSGVSSYVTSSSAWSSARSFVTNPAVQNRVGLVAVGGLLVAACLKPEYVTKTNVLRAAVAAVAAVAFTVLSPVMGMVAAASVLGGVSYAFDGWAQAGYKFSLGQVPKVAQDFLLGAIFGAGLVAAPQAFGII